MAVFIAIIFISNSLQNFLSYFDECNNFFRTYAAIILLLLKPV